MSEIEKYLTLKGISFRVNGDELITKCLFSNCDSDSQGSEAHLYFSKDTGQYQCFKCSEKGNLTTLKKYFGDKILNQNKIMTNADIKKTAEVKPKKNAKTLTQTLVEKNHKELTPEIIEYLHTRGISDEIIKSSELGYGLFYGRWWITIPIKDIDGNYVFFKLRQDPRHGKGKMTWPNGIEAQIYDWNSLLFSEKKLVICEGETDALLLKSKGVPCITNTHGANTVKNEWMEHFKKDTEYYICYDNDIAGRNGAQKMSSALLKHGCYKINIINLPEEVGDKGDLGDYLVRLNLPIEDLFSKYSQPYPEKIDSSKFQEINIEDVCRVLDSVIKKDDANKAITFLSMLNTYTEESQLNVFFNAPSSTGKSHIPLSTVQLYPKEDQIILAYCSPTAFFHEQGVYDKERNVLIVDLSKKILIFTDMPDPSLLTKLRPILSHDQKESEARITDKNQKGGMKTKKVILIGYPSVYFCSAGLRVDEQESTRFIMLSPSVEHDKIIQGIQQVISKESNQEKFASAISENPERKLLMERIIAIKQENIMDVKIDNSRLIEDMFIKDHKNIKPRQQRDIKKIIYLIKSFALLNLWFRKREERYIWATDEDIRNAFKLWEQIASGQDYGLAPYIYDIYTKIILSLWNGPSNEFGALSDPDEKKTGITRREILNKHFEIYHRPLGSQYLRQHILPQLEQAGLIAQEKSVNDGREMLVIPLETDVETTSDKVITKNTEQPTKETGVKNIW
jgi:DNA primase